MIQRKPIRVERVPISVTRIPIKLDRELKLRIKIQEMQELTWEEDILEISSHYDMLARRVLNKSGYNSLSLKNPTAHKNWAHFERVHQICLMKSWDSKLYIEAQFNRTKDWQRFKYPLPNMLYSVNALKYFTNHLANIQKTYNKDVDFEKRKRGSETKTLRSEIIEQIVESVEMLNRYIVGTKHEDKGQYKAMKIFQSWEEFSPYYLWSIPWFHRVLPDLDGIRVKDCVDKFTLIHKNFSLQKVIKETVQQVETSYDIPPNISLE